MSKQQPSAKINTSACNQTRISQKKKQQPGPVEYGAGPYLRQQPSYPTPQQPAYTTHPYPAQQISNPAGQPPGTSHYGEPPPPYAMTPQGLQYPTMPAVTGGYNHPQVPQQMYRQSHPSATSFRQQPIQVTGSFDPGARFGAGATANIPPPPPGVAPTNAQMASVQGQHVVMQQQQAGWFEGGPGGGSTFW